MGRLTRILVPGLLLLSVYYAVFGGEFSAFDVRDAEDEVERVRDELERLRAENDSMRLWADALENDPAVLERLAREELGLIKPGERLYRIDEVDSDATNDDGGDPDGSG